MLYLRWMVRPADGIDLGLWREIPASLLLVPVDTHIHKLGRNLGFTRRANLSWQTAEEITEALRQFDRRDPTKYDFALCHLGCFSAAPRGVTCAMRGVRRAAGMPTLGRGVSGSTPGAPARTCELRK